MTVDEVAAEGSVLTGVFTLVEGTPRTIGYHTLVRLDGLVLHK